MAECPLKSLCATPSVACQLEYLVEYCFPVFRLTPDRKCSACGKEGVNCYSANGMHQGECLDCYCSFIFHQQGMMAGLSPELVNRLVERTKHKHLRVEKPTLSKILH